MNKILRRNFTQKNQNRILATYNVMQRYFAEIRKKIEGERVIIKFKKNVFNIFQKLEEKFPKTMQHIRLYNKGVKNFYSDLQKYISIIKKQKSQGINSLTLEELQLRITMPKDIVKLSPTLLLFIVPFTNYIIIPLAYYFPQYLLTRHFWTAQQKMDFMLAMHKSRSNHSQILLQYMQEDIKRIDNNVLKTKCENIIERLINGRYVSTIDILTCYELFAGPPYSLESLRTRHLQELLAVHGMSQWGLFRKRRLMVRGLLLKQMDLIIIREGGVINMSKDSLYWALSHRGVNPENLSIEAMKNWLLQWLIISKNVNKNTISLLLHGPILLARKDLNNSQFLYK